MRSDKVTKGVEKAPMRSLFYAMGYTKEELERPLIGVVSAQQRDRSGPYAPGQGCRGRQGRRKDGGRNTYR